MLSTLFADDSLLRRSLATVALIAAPFTLQAAAQQQAPPSALVPYEFDSGLAENTGSAPDIVLSFPVFMGKAAWLRLNFDEVQLSGDILAGTGSILRITALEDGAIQEMDARHVEQWANSSAYFNGDTVLVEVLAYPGTGMNRVSMSEMIVGLSPDLDSDPTICGLVDDRILSSDPRSARLLPIGCTGWLITDCRQCFLTAGHCVGNINVVQFNVPLSNANGDLNHPGPEDQYAWDPSSLQNVPSYSIGNDWGYFGAFANSTTGLTPGAAQGPGFDLVAAPTNPAGNDMRITGFGVDSDNQDQNQVQQTHVGPFVSVSGTTLQYETDTTGGNSGSPVIWEQTGQVIGIHTNGGCGTTSGANSGTSVMNPGLQAALAMPIGICSAGLGLTSGPAASVLPGIATTLEVEVFGTGTAVTMHYRMNGGAFLSQLMTSQGGAIYTASLPAAQCGDSPQYYFSFQESSCGLQTTPSGAPAAFYSLAVGIPIASFVDNFEMDLGWATSSNGASTGQWERGVPVNDTSWEYAPEADSDGSGSCYLTQNEAGNTDIDGGSVTLRSPTVDLSTSGAYVAYDYYMYLSNDDGTDRMLVEARNGSGAWAQVALHTVSGGSNWRSHTLNSMDFTAAGVSLTNDVQVRFTGNDSGTATFCEMGIDAFFVGEFVCSDSVGTNYCSPAASGAAISTLGTASVAANDLSLIGSGLPTNVSGIFFYGDMPDFAPLGDGIRCVTSSGGVIRLSPVGNSGPAGQITHALDITSPPVPSGQITPGSTWNFQMWFRDGGSSNLTDATEIQFLP
ncbi:MAG: V8-like Glu-specific endopeptidase [Planctomycetota bacterium]|jgi:V8-like Glu-specific endopeptidase